MSKDTVVTSTLPEMPKALLAAKVLKKSQVIKNAELSAVGTATKRQKVLLKLYKSF